MMKTIKFFVIIFILIGQLQCSTEKNSIVHRGFHNLHAKYNGFFNANEIIKLTYNDFLKSRKEDYNSILPVFPLPNEEESKGWYAPMDTAYRKCELVIFRHRMPHKKKGKYRNKEWGKYIDDNWLTMGKTKFYKKDFPNALKIFQHIENKYPIENNYYQSIFWQSKVLIEMGAFDEAEEILLTILLDFEEQIKKQQPTKKISLKDKLKLAVDYNARIDYLESRDALIPDKIINSIYPTLADLYIKSKNNIKAIEFLELATENKYKKSFKTRLIFILAQLHHLQGNYKASVYYQEVVERNPEYEMAFQAKINRALSFSGGDSKAIKAQLLKMLKDDKNIEYFDQIYYALAEISFTDQNEPLGIEQLQKSINLSLNDNQQKIKSMVRMGDLFFEKSKYIKSYYYYDSVKKIPLKDYREKEIVEKKYKILKNIFLNNSTVTRNDSLFMVCSLSPKERMEKIYEVVDLQEAKKNNQTKSPLTASSQNRLSGPSSNSVINQSFFIWDQSMLQRGKSEFDKKWGKMPLEDNWRRSSKSSLFIEDNEEALINTSQNDLFDELVKNLPCDKKDLLESMNDSILLSLFNLGLIHHYETEDLTQSIKYFTRIIENFQPQKEAIASIYELYNIFSFQKEYGLSTKMKNLLLDKYPQSKYAQLISGVKNTSDLQEKMNLEEENYRNLYLKYKSGKYEEVLESCNEKLIDTSNLLICQYGLLKAYSLKKMNDTSSNNEVLINTLKIVVKRCLGTNYSDQAIAALNALKINSANNLINKENWKFSYSPDTIHYFIMIAPKGKFSINKAKNSIADFNMSNFSDLRLKVSNSFLNTSDQMIMVKFFNDSKKALDYYLSFKVNKGIVKNYKEENFFVISPDNLRELYLEKNPDNYVKFFEEFYQ
mgnify:FL=1